MTTKPKLPAWGIIVGVGLILFGLLGFFSDVQGIYVDELVDLQESILNPSAQHEEEDVFEEFDQDWQQMMDSLESKDAQWEELDALQEQLEVVPETLEGDSSLVHSIDSLKAILGGEDGFDEMDRVDLTEFERESLRKVGNMPKAFSDMFSVSDHTKLWTKRFAWIGLIINLVLIAGGIWMLMMKKWSPRLAMVILAVSILASVARILIITGDAETGFFAKVSWLGEVWSIFLDLGLLITLLVVDKSPYTGVQTLRSPQPTPSLKGDGEDF